MVNAKTVNKLLPDSRLVIQDGAGVRPPFLPLASPTAYPASQHCSLALVSLCVGKVVREYFIDGTLPENGKVCPITEVLFPEPQVSILEGESDDGRLWGAENAQAMSGEDLVLLGKLRAFGEIASEHVRGFKRRV